MTIKERFLRGTSHPLLVFNSNKEEVLAKNSKKFPSVKLLVDDNCRDANNGVVTHHRQKGEIAGAGDKVPPPNSQ